MKVHWTDRAKQRLKLIHEHIAKDAPLVAPKVVERLIRRSIQIGELPRSGRAAVAGVSRDAGTHDRRDHARRIDGSHPLIRGVGDEKAAIGRGRRAVHEVERRRSRLTPDRRVAGRPDTMAAERRVI